MEKEKLPTLSGDVFLDTDRMHKRFGFYLTDDQVTFEHLMHRLDFIQEELDETRKALIEGDAADVIDGFIDQIVVAAGSLSCLGINAQQAWINVMDANNAKVVGMNDKRPGSGGQDLIKPEGWKAPDHKLLVSDRLWRLISESQEERKRIMDSWTPKEDRPAVKILLEAAQLMRDKSSDYIFEGSSVRAADYYPRGIDSLVEIIDTHKRFRQISILEKIKAGVKVKFEGLRDTLIDRINYLAIAVEWIDGKMQGQNPDHDIFNRPKGDTNGNDSK